MQIAVLSDLHLGRRNELDRFARTKRCVEPKFLALLRHLERHVDKIVLLGDIFETLKGPHPGSTRDELRGALESYPEIARRAVDDPRYQLVHGNHDVVAKDALGALEFFEVEDRDQRLVFFHGHQLDPLTRGRALLSRAGCWLGGWLERVGVDVTPHDAVARPDSTFSEYDGYFERAAVALGASRGADIIVTGHTHRAMRAEHGERLFMNSGSCVAGRRELLLLDTARGRYEVIHEPALLGV
jgi:UDP-2,3-diacylglucosamine pyrophosphatase LpxH